MNENKKVFFIINKFAGTGYKTQLEGRILSHCEELRIEPTIEFTQGPNHANELSHQAAISNKFDIVFAVGGDGTVNEVAQGLVHTKQIMGILPNGSGNGLARHLGISMNFNKALEMLRSDTIIAMDSFLINDKLSVNVSGIGFDGHVAGLFSKGGKRGLIGYTRFVLQEFFNFKEFSATILLDGKTSEKDAFVIAFANSSQFGNNARVSPHASVCDGVLDVCFIRKVPVTHAFGFAHKMFTSQIEKSSWVEIVKAKQLTLSFEDAMPYHVDGEAMKPTHNFSIIMQPASISMLVPDNSATCVEKY
jgi:diacylglycerol kinase (ATP)